MRSTTQEAATAVQSLSLDFSLPNSRSGSVNVSLKPDSDPAENGLKLLFSAQDMDTFKGFPVCEATVEAFGTRGYGSMYGWIQMVRSGEPSTISSVPWEMDPIPFLAGLNTPFCWFGPEPKLYDAPVRTGVQRLDWTCHSYFTYIDDALLSKVVKPVLGFGWGFVIEQGKPSVKALREVSLGTWNEHRGLLEMSFGGWEFHTVATRTHVACS